MSEQNHSEPPVLSAVEAADPDPAIAALLGFAPVLRRNRRRDGWSEERQRAFVAALARCGSVGEAADSVGRTYAGARKVRSAGGSGEFAAAWDKALDLCGRRIAVINTLGADISHDTRHASCESRFPSAPVWPGSPGFDP